MMQTQKAQQKSWKPPKGGAAKVIQPHIHGSGLYRGSLHRRDKYEYQADEAARRILRGEKGVARILTPTPAASYKISASTGQPLPHDVRSELEEGFGADFSAVRIHNDSYVDSAVRNEGARAFASGTDIYFAAGNYDPSKEAGKELLIHEVAHVLQQTARRNSNHLLQAVPVVSNGAIQHDLIENLFSDFDVFTAPPTLEEVIKRHLAEHQGDSELKKHGEYLQELLGEFKEDHPAIAELIEKIQNPGFIEKTEYRALYFDCLKGLKQYSAAMEMVENTLPPKTAFGLIDFYKKKARGEMAWLTSEIDSEFMQAVLNRISGFPSSDWLSGIVNSIKPYISSSNDKTHNVRLQSRVEKIFADEIRIAATSGNLIPNERFYVALAAFRYLIRFIGKLPVDRIKIMDQEETSDATKQITKSNLIEIAREQSLPGEALELLRMAEPEIIKAMHVSQASLQQIKTEEEKADQAGKDEGQTPAAPGEVSTPETAAVSEPPPEAEETGEDIVGVSAAPVEEMKPQPTFELPPMPDTELSPEERAKLEAEREKAAAAIEEATSPGGTLDGYSEAPPSVMAAAQTTMGEKIGTQVQTEQQEFESNIPEIVAETRGEDEIEGVPELETGAKSAGDLEGAAPPPAEMPELSPTQDLGKFDENNKIVDFIKRFFGLGDNEKAVRNNLRDVETKDRKVESSPGPPPEVPLENDTDPKRVTDQQEQARQQTRDERDQAMQEVVDGPGPEQVQVRELKAQAAVEPFEPPEIKEMVAAEGASEFTSRELPPEVTAKFDEDYREQMTANMEEGRQQVKQAETERDEGRAQKLEKAEQERDALANQADENQKKEVLHARETIQAERQATIEEQDKAVADLEDEAEIKKTETQKDIDKKSKETNKDVIQKYDKAESDAKKEVSKGEKDAEAERRKAEKEAENKSWWEKAVDFVKKAFAALTKVINAIFDVVRAAINKVLDAVKSVVKGLIDLAASAIKGMIKVFGEVLKGLVNTLLADTFPGLAKKLNNAIDGAVETATKAVDAVADTLKAGVDLVVGALQKGLNFVLNTFQAAVNIAVAVVEAAITGDWSGLVRKLIESTLRLLGISPETFYSFVGKTADTLKIIIDAPGAFLGNCVDAVKKGFDLLADNFLKHLKASIIGWLTGSLGGDIQIPERFDLMGVLDLARQVMGLTWEWLREKAVRLIGEKNVERLEFAFDYIKTLAQEGWGALFEKIKEDLSTLKDFVLDKIKEFLAIEVIKAGIKWLVSLFNPVGALVKLVMTMWNLYTFLRDQLSRIIEIVKSLVSGIDKIARGDTQEAGEKVEGVLARLLPIAIDLVARLLDLGNVGKKVREIIKNIRKRINKAADKLLNKIMKGFKKKGAEETDTGGAKEGAQAGQVKLGRAMTVTEPGGKIHTLSIDVKGKDATIMLRSKPTTVKAWIKEFKTRAQNLKDDEKDKKKIIELIGQASAIQDTLDAASDKKVRKETPKNTTPILEQETKLRDTLISLFQILGTAAEVPVEIRFKTQIDSAHPLAKASLIKALQLNLDKWQSLPWKDIEKKLKEKTDPFHKPLLKIKNSYGEGMQKLISEKLKVLRQQNALRQNESEQKSIPDKNSEGKFISNTLVRKVHDGSGEQYKNALMALRAALFDKSKQSAAVRSLDPALEQALKDYRGQDKADEDLVKEVSGKIISFLIAMAKGEAFGNISVNDWKTRIWGQRANRKWIMKRFRKSGGKHEWIPTDYVGEVIAHAHAVSTTECEETAVRWVEFQDELRSPTKMLIFNPAKETYKVTVNRLRDISDPAKKTKKDLTQAVPVLQGHTGAVYAPYSGNSYRDDNVPQTKGQKQWHDKLRAIFNTNKSNQNSSVAMKKVLSEIDTHVNDTLWEGNAAVLGAEGSRFEEYYESASGTTPDGVGFLITAAKGAEKQIKEDFNRAREAAKLD